MLTIDSTGRSREASTFNQMLPTQVYYVVVLSILFILIYHVLSVMLSKLDMHVYSNWVIKIGFLYDQWRSTVYLHVVSHM